MKSALSIYLPNRIWDVLPGFYKYRWFGNQKQRILYQGQCDWSFKELLFVKLDLGRVGGRFTMPAVNGSMEQIDLGEKKTLVLNYIQLVF